MDTFLSLGFSVQILILFSAIFLFVPILRSLYLSTNNIIPVDVLSFPFSTCTEDDFRKIRNKVEIFTEALFKGKNLVELTLNDYELNALASRGKGVEFYPVKTRSYDYYKIEDSSIIWKHLTYPIPFGLKGFVITTKQINISIENETLKGTITSISQNDWIYRIGKTSHSFNGWRLFNDIFYIDRVTEIDDIVSKLEDIQVRENAIRFISKQNTFEKNTIV